MTDDRVEGGLKQGVGKLQDAIGGLTGDMGAQVHGKINQAAGAVQGLAGKMKDHAEDNFGQTKDRAQELYAKVGGYAGEQPLRTLAVTLALGVLVGLLIRGGPKTVYVRK